MNIVYGDVVKASDLPSVPDLYAGPGIMISGSKEQPIIGLMQTPGGITKSVRQVTAGLTVTVNHGIWTRDVTVSAYSLDGMSVQPPAIRQTQEGSCLLDFDSRDHGRYVTVVVVG